MEEFLKHLRAVDLEHLDFEWVSPGDAALTSLIPSGASADLIVFAKQASGSLIAVWKKIGASDLSSPVVWIDSEGFPNAVIAPNLKTFFALLPYGTGLLYDLAFGLVRFLENPKSNKRYLKGLTPKRFSIDRKEIENDARTKGLIDVLTNQWQTKLPIDPLEAIQKAMENEVDFNLWLQSKRP